MFITKKHLSRRTVLRGMGAALALPLLDGMVPAVSAIANTAAKPVRRLGAIYFPNGAHMAQWTPATEGAGFEFSRTLEPLSPYRDRLTVISGLCNKQADPIPGEGGGDHSRSQVAFLTGAHAKKTQANPEAGVSIDQIVAKEFGQHTQLASLELALESNDMVGGCEFGLACAYSGTIAWSNATTPLPMENDPRAVFERLFGASESTDPRVRLARIQKDRSILDMVTGELAHLQTKLGSGDRTKITEYVESVRDIERRIQKAEEQSGQDVLAVEQPGGVPATYEEYSKLMFDLMRAYQTDMTRVATFLVGREQSGRTFPEIGVPQQWHPTSHHGNDAVQLEKYAKINKFNVELFAHFLEKLKTTPDGDGTLLDHSMILYGCGMSNGNGHIHHNLPILLAGGAAGQLKGGRHVKFNKDPNRACDHETPLANLHLTMLEKMGVPVENLGDSTGKLELLSGV
jgi:hypothetical protein